MQELSTSFNYEARYFKIGQIDETTKSVWFVLHGYGQLAKYFGEKFKSLADNNVCVIVPEGLSRFYIENIETRLASGNNRVGASWMTRENREMDIRNYIEFLNTIYHQELSVKKAPVTLVGFSQGAATASRWAIANQIEYDRLILWSGIFPPDMDFEKGNEVLSQKNVLIVYGNKDPLITKDKISELNGLVSRLKIEPTVIEFNGGHEINREVLESLC